MQEKQERIGALLCCAASAVMKVERIKELIDELAKMGYDLLELCIDDVYKIPEEPYFGYLRGGYTKEELQDLDNYAKSKGVELVPCIQLLGHLSRLVKLPRFSNIVDTGDILLVGEEETYELIEKMFKTIRACFSTNLVNISMDEVANIGLGKYLKKHGYTDKTTILLQHLNRVVKIADKYGFKPHMWSDMFFKFANGGRYYGEDVKLSQEAIDKVPEGVGLCYWDYGEHAIKEEIFENMFKEHQRFNREIWFAGGAWCWDGFAPLNNWSLYTMEPAMRQARKYGVKNILITLWADQANECSVFSVLPSLYAIKQFYEGNFDMDSISKGFYDLFGVKFEDFMLLDLPNKVERENFIRENPCKSLFYNDCFLGWEDWAYTQVPPIRYAEYSAILKSTSKRMGKYEYLFKNMSLLCSAMELKAGLGIETRNAYRANDKEALKKLVDKYTLTAKRVKAFSKDFRARWLMDNKPFGWEIQQVRLGGLYSRILDCRDRLIEYVEGKVEDIPELEEDILPFVPAWGLNYNSWRNLVTVSIL